MNGGVPAIGTRPAWAGDVTSRKGRLMATFPLVMHLQNAQMATAASSRWSTINGPLLFHRVVFAPAGLCRFHHGGNHIQPDFCNPGGLHRRIPRLFGRALDLWHGDSRLMGVGVWREITDVYGGKITKA